MDGFSASLRALPLQLYRSHKVAAAEQYLALTNKNQKCHAEDCARKRTGHAAYRPTKSAFQSAQT